MPQLTEKLGAQPGSDNSFAKIGPEISEDPATWDRAIHWLEQETAHYENVVKAIIPQDIGS